MANPQAENGHTRIANELLEALARAKFNGIQSGIINTIIRQTYGYNRKEIAISDGFIANAINSSRKSVNREMQALISNKIVLVIKEATYTTPRVLKLNKNYDEWVQNGRQSPNLGIPEMVATSSPELVPCSSPEIEDRGSPELVAQINTYIKDNNKENINKDIYCRFGGKGAEKMERRKYNVLDEDDYDKSHIGWWKFYKYFDDEELNDLFIKLLDMTEEQSNGFINGVGTAYEFVKMAIVKDAEIELIDNTEELKVVLRKNLYKNDIQTINEYLGFSELIKC